MLESRFDQWLQTIAAANLSRRGGLRLAIGSGVAAVFGQAATRGAAACRAHRFPCKVDAQCCSGVCKGRKHHKRCKRAKGAFGCTIDDDACMPPGTFTLCPNRPEGGACVQLDSGAAFCFVDGGCASCRKHSDCPRQPGRGTPKCVRRCKTCGDIGGGSACLYGP